MICPNCNADTGGRVERAYRGRNFTQRRTKPHPNTLGVVCDECHTWDYEENWERAEREHNRKQEAKSKLEYCIGCGTEMIGVIDNDPNGAPNATCARCRAEEAHDFDIEPDVEFDRSGSIVERVGEWQDLGMVEDGSARKYEHSITGLSFYIHRTHGAISFMGLPCAAKADGTLEIVSETPVDTAGKLLSGG